MAFEQRVLAVEDADAGRTVELVAGESVEVAIEFLHIDREVRHRLSAVDQHRNAAAMGGVDDALHRIDRAQRVGDVNDRHQLRPRRQQLLEFLYRGIRRDR